MANHGTFKFISMMPQSIEVESVPRVVGLDLNTPQAIGNLVMLNMEPGEALNLADAIRLAAYAAIENRSDNG